MLRGVEERVMAQGSCVSGVYVKVSPREREKERGTEKEKGMVKEEAKCPKEHSRLPMTRSTSRSRWTRWY